MTAQGEPSEPLVSVIIPAYNHAAYVERAIRSVLNQTYPNIELVVVDDGSTDETWSIIRETREKSPREFQIHTKSNEGISATLNFGIGKSSGRYIAVLASDDYYLQNKIERQIALFQRSSAATALVHSNALIDYGDGTAPIPARELQAPAVGACFLELLSAKARIIAPTAMFTRDAYAQVGGFDEHLVAEDVDFYVRLAAAGYEMRYDPSPLVVKSETPRSLGTRTSLSADLSLKILQKHRSVLTAKQFAELENGIYRRRGQAASYTRHFGLAIKYYALLAYRTRSIIPCCEFFASAAKGVALALMSRRFQYGVRSMRQSSRRTKVIA